MFQKQLHVPKKHKIFSEAAAHFLIHKKYVQKQLHKFSRLLHKTYTLFSWSFEIMKNIYDGY